ncbi:MAG: sll1863 family stress response protein [Nitrospiria bacterium]
MDKVMMEEKETYQNTMETRLGRLGTRIDELQTEAVKLSGKTRMEINKWIAELRVKQASIRQNFQEMKHAGGDIWLDLKSGLEKATTDLKETLDKVGPKIKQFPHIQPAAKWLGLIIGGAVTGYFIGRFIHKRK